MLSDTISQSRWLSFIMLLMLLFTVLGPMDNAWMNGRVNDAYGDQRAARTDRRPPHDTGSPVHARESKGQGIAALGQPLAEVRSIRELMERNKIYPTLHKDLSKYKTVEVVATGYSAGVESTGKSPGHPEYGITYSGVKVKRSVLSTIAADLNVFPLGTILFIPGYGYGIVADIGSAIKGNKLDLYFETKDDVYRQWGKKKVNVFVIQQGKGKVNEAMLDEWNKAIPAQIVAGSKKM